MHASILHSESQTGTAPSSFLLPPSSFLFPPPPRQPTGIPTSGRACECLGPSLAGKLNCECVVAWGGIGWHPRRGSRYLKLEAGVGNSMSFFVSSLAGNLSSEGVVAPGSVHACAFYSTVRGCLRAFQVSRSPGLQCPLVRQVSNRSSIGNKL